jgi:ABC-type amino acid transport substrate-binding protein
VAPQLVRHQPAKQTDFGFTVHLTKEYLMQSLITLLHKLGQVLMLLLALGVASQAMAATSSLENVQKRGVLRVGWAPWFPYAYKDPKTNQVSGIAADMIKEIATSLKVDVQWVEDNWGTMIAGLQADKFDMLMPMAVTPPRAEAATFTDPFLKTSLGLMVRTADQQKYKVWKDLDKEGATIAVAMGSNTAMYAKQVFSKAKVIEMKGEPESVTNVVTGKVDAWASTYSTFSASAPGRSQLVVVPGEPFASNPIALVVRKGDDVFRDRLNQILREQKSSGAVTRIAKKQGLPEADFIE